MEVFTGIDSIFYIKYEGLWVPISCEVSSPMSETVEMINTTTRDNAGWKTEKPTLQSYSISISAVLKRDIDTQLLSYQKIRQLKRNRTLIEWKRVLLNGVVNDYGKAYIVDISDSNTVGEEITFDLSLNGYGKPLESSDIVYVLAEEIEVLIGDKDNNLIES